MHSDHAEVQASIRKYMTVGGMLLVFTVITVAASYFNLAVPAAITLALVIAAMKGSMVAAIFMHLSHERRWIYGALLLTLIGFLILLFVPVATTMDTIGTHWPVPTKSGHAGH